MTGINKDDSHGLDAHIFWVGMSRQSTINPLEWREAQLIGTSKNIVVWNHTNSTQDLTQSSVSYNIYFYHWDYLPHNHNRICEMLKLKCHKYYYGRCAGDLLWFISNV